MVSTVGHSLVLDLRAPFIIDKEPEHSLYFGDPTTRNLSLLGRAYDVTFTTGHLADSFKYLATSMRSATVSIELYNQNTTRLKEFLEERDRERRTHQKWIPYSRYRSERRKLI